MKIVGFEDIANLKISPRVCYEWTERMIADKAAAFLPAKTHMNLPGNVFCNVMPGIIGTPYGKMGGVKVVTRYPERRPSLDSKILLFDAQTGEFLSLMDGNWITAYRTGAVAVHSILTFAKKNFTTLGFIGLGNVSRTTMLILASMITDRKLVVKLLRYKDQAEDFADRFKDFDNIEFRIVDSVKECIKGSEVVVSGATYFEDDIARDDWFDEGVLVVPIHTRGFTNCDLFFDKVFADDTGHVQDFKNFSRFKSFAEVCDVVCNRAPGRESDRERILAYNIGVSIHDINYAVHIYHLLLQDQQAFSKLTDSNMKEPVEKFWV